MPVKCPPTACAHANAADANATHPSDPVSANASTADATAVAAEALGERVVVVDMEGATGLCARRPEGCCPLGVHPNSGGYDAMAAVWHDAVLAHAPPDRLRAAAAAAAHSDGGGR